MNKQISLSNLEDELSQVRTKKKEFLEQIERIVPWNEWVAMIKPCYYKGERGNKPYELELMLRLYLIQNLYNLADEATVAEVTDSRAFSAQSVGSWRGSDPATGYAVVFGKSERACTGMAARQGKGRGR